MRFRRCLLVLSAAFMFLAGCGDSDDSAQDNIDQIEDTVREGADDVAEAADNAWASFRTNFERLVDKAATGDSEAQEELLQNCRDTLQDLREADDPDADRVGELCDKIRDADDDTAWDELRSEVEELDTNR